MKRREFIKAIGGTAAAWPLGAHAQQPKMPVIGFLRSTTPADSTQRGLVTAFRDGLKKAGFIEGQNVAIEYRYADNQADRLPALVADLVRRPVAVFVANSIAALAAKTATTSVPIVFTTGGDPINDGLVASLNRPGGNVTGVSFFAGTLGSKRLEFLRQLVPKATTIGVLVNPNTAETEAERKDLQTAAQKIGQQLIVLDASSDHDIGTRGSEAEGDTFTDPGTGAGNDGDFAIEAKEVEDVVHLRVSLHEGVTAGAYAPGRFRCRARPGSGYRAPINGTGAESAIGTQTVPWQTARPRCSKRVFFGINKLIAVLLPRVEVVVYFERSATQNSRNVQ